MEISFIAQHAVKGDYHSGRETTDLATAIEEAWGYQNRRLRSVRIVRSDGFTATPGEAYHGTWKEPK